MNENLTLLAAYTDLYKPHKRARLSNQSDLLYRIAIEQWGKALGRAVTLADLIDASLIDHLGVLGETLAPPTVNQRRSKLLALWNWLARKGYVSTWPDVPRVPEANDAPVAWRRSEMRRIMRACREVEGRIARIDGVCWWLAIHHWWWTTGERTGATLACPYAAYDFRSGIARVPASIRKGRKPAVYTLPLMARKFMRQIQQPDNRKLLFPFEGDRSTFYNHYTRLLRSAGLPSGRRDKPQKIRRSFASYIEAAGGDAAKALMHTDRRVTESYIDRSIAQGQNWGRMMPGL